MHVFSFIVPIPNAILVRSPAGPPEAATFLVIPSEVEESQPSQRSPRCFDYVPIPALRRDRDSAQHDRSAGSRARWALFCGYSMSIVAAPSSICMPLESIPKTRYCGAPQAAALRTRSCRARACAMPGKWGEAFIRSPFARSPRAPRRHNENCCRARINLRKGEVKMT